MSKHPKNQMQKCPTYVIMAIQLFLGRHASIEIQVENSLTVWLERIMADALFLSGLMKTHRKQVIDIKFSRRFQMSYTPKASKIERK